MPLTGSLQAAENEEGRVKDLCLAGPVHDTGARSFLGEVGRLCLAFSAGHRLLNFPLTTASSFRSLVGRFGFAVAPSCSSTVSLMAYCIC